jgi:hypothetical protein
MTKPSFITAMICFAVLALLAGLTLDGKLRYATWIVLGYFAIRTYVAHRADWSK